MKTVVLTAFEPFGNDSINPTETILARIPDFLYDAKIVKVTLPVVYKEAFDTLEPYLKKHNPVLVILLGLAGGRTHLSIERIAMNMNHSDSPDNKGNILKYAKIIENGDDGLFTTYPLEKLMNRLIKENLPVKISNSAGGYVCNDTMYRLLHYLKTNDLKTFGGFIHVPYLHEQVLDKTAPSMALKPMIDTVLTIIDTLINPIELNIRQL